jgi:hypothetical protein
MNALKIAHCRYARVHKAVHNRAGVQPIARTEHYVARASGIAQAAERSAAVTASQEDGPR